MGCVVYEHNHTCHASIHPLSSTKQKRASLILTPWKLASFNGNCKRGRQFSLTINRTTKSNGRVWPRQESRDRRGGAGVCIWAGPGTEDCAGVSELRAGDEVGAGDQTAGRWRCLALSQQNPRPNCAVAVRRIDTPPIPDSRLAVFEARVPHRTTHVRERRCCEREDVPNTVVKIHKIRHPMMSLFNAKNMKRIGGSGLVVEIDECHLHSRKYGVGLLDASDLWWVFAGCLRIR